MARKSPKETEIIKLINELLAKEELNPFILHALTGYMTSSWRSGSEKLEGKVISYEVKKLRTYFHSGLDPRAYEPRCMLNVKMSTGKTRLISQRGFKKYCRGLYRNMRNVEFLAGYYECKEVREE